MLFRRLARPSRGVAALVVLPAALWAQPPVTWCEKPARDPVWDRQTAYLALEIADSDSLPVHTLLKPALPIILDGVAREFMTARQPGRGSSVAALEELPTGEPRYGPLALRTSVRFQLRGDGAVDSIATGRGADSTLASDLSAALQAAVARGEVFGPYGDSTVRTHLSLSVSPYTWPGTPHWPAFSINAPIHRQIRPRPGNRLPPYPREAKGWKAELLYEFVVNEEGQIEPGSIRNLRPPERYAWPTLREQEIYEAFVREVERVIASWRYEPADVLGCRVRQRANQPVTFDTR